MNELTHFSLFSGIGGIDLASEWAGFRTVGQCEFAEYPTKVLEKHWPDVPRWKDVRDVTVGSIREKGIKHITVLSGGFPCQPFSCAGKRKGKEDNRHLWPEMLRIVSECRPSWVLGENVGGIINMELGNCIASLEGLEYSVRAFYIPACGVQARHQRYRVFIVGHTKHNGQFTVQDTEGLNRGSDTGKERQGIPGELTRSGCGERGDNNVADTKYIKWDGGGTSRNLGGEPSNCCNVADPHVSNTPQCRNNARVGGCREQNAWDTRVPWTSEPNVGRVAHGVPKRVDRLKCLGNAVVPQQVYPILKAIADIETMGIKVSYNTR